METSVMHSSVLSCGNCCSKQECRHRAFNDDVWDLLVEWGEVEKESRDLPMCAECYRDIRDLLIDRSQEMEVALKQVSMVSAMSSPNPKVRHAS